MAGGAEVLIDPPLSMRGQKFMQAMASAAPAGSTVTTSYSGRRNLLMLYGPGSPRKMPAIRQHLAKGGHVAMWDLGYWDREHGMRLSIDFMHPTIDQLQISPRLGKRSFELREDHYAPDGHILLVGLGAKSVFTYGLQPLEWETKKLKELRQRFPGKRIVWRPKGHKPVGFDDLDISHGDPICNALFGCALVACRHSNVAIDACIAGVPVECDDGAAAALYRGNPYPTIQQRADFLQRLSWWEWRRDEAKEAWAWILRVVNG